MKPGGRGRNSSAADPAATSILQLVFWITIVAITATVTGFSPVLCVLESHSPVAMAGNTLPCVQIAGANREAN